MKDSLCPARTPVMPINNTPISVDNAPGCWWHGLFISVINFLTDLLFACSGPGQSFA